MTVYVGVDGKLAGTIRDRLRSDAAVTIQGLQQQGIKMMLLSGAIMPSANHVWTGSVQGCQLVAKSSVTADLHEAMCKSL